MRFTETQYTTATKILFLLPPFFLIPLPTSVELTGELIKLTPKSAKNLDLPRNAYSLKPGAGSLAGALLFVKPTRNLTN